MRDKVIKAGQREGSETGPAGEGLRFDAGSGVPHLPRARQGERLEPGPWVWHREVLAGGLVHVIGRE
jgi:hypothetical protein